MGPRNAYKYMLDNVVSPITCVSMYHQNQLEQMANGAMFATLILFGLPSMGWRTPPASRASMAGPMPMKSASGRPLASSTYVNEVDSLYHNREGRVEGEWEHQPRTAPPSRCWARSG
jgi:hypothetical protein